MPAKTVSKIVVLVILIVVVTLFAVQQKQKQSVPASVAPAAKGVKPASVPFTTQDISKIKKKAAIQNNAEIKEKQTSAAPVQKLPRLVELGADKCIPCKMMAPILEELRNEYKGKLQVEFIDVWENQSAGDRYGIQVIPTQIFFDPSGKELFRHVGFMGKEDILAKWKELGFNLTAAS